MRTRSSGARPAKDASNASNAPSTPTASGDNEAASPRFPRRITRTSSNMSTHSQIVVGEKPVEQKLKLTWNPPIITISGLKEGQFPREKDLLSPLSPKRTRRSVRGMPEASPSQSSQPSQNSQNSQPTQPRMSTRRSQNSVATSSPAKKMSESPPKPVAEKTRKKNEVDNHVDENFSPKEEQYEETTEEHTAPSFNLSVEMADPIPTLTPAKSNLSDMGGSQLSQTRVTPNENSVPEMDDSDDELSDSDLPPAFYLYPKTPTEEECDDAADYVLKTRFLPMTDAQVFVDALTKRSPSQRSTETLKALAKNTAEALIAWQNQFLVLDARTAPHAHPPKKPATGGRVPTRPDLFEEMKQAELWNYSYDSKKKVQDPFAQRLGRRTDESGRALRTRRGRDVLGPVTSGTKRGASDEAAISDDDSGNGGIGTRRKRRVTSRLGHSLAPTPEPPSYAPPSGRGRGRGRGRGAKRMSSEAFTHENEYTPRKRGRWGVRSVSALPPRVREMRAESIATTDSEGTSVEGSPEPSGADSKSNTPAAGTGAGGSVAGSTTSQPQQPPKRRGRPPGSKNVAKRSDAGIKKGPRKWNVTKLENLTTPTTESPTAGPTTTTEMAVSATTMNPDQSGFTDPALPPPNLNSTNPSYLGISRAPPARLSPAPTVEGKVPISRLPPPPSAGGLARSSPAPATAFAGTTAVDTSSPESSTGAPNRRKQHVKSEKRSESMTRWWMARKAKQKAEAEEAAAAAAAQQQAADEAARAQSGVSGSPPASSAMATSTAYVDSAAPNDAAPIPPHPAATMPPPTYPASATPLSSALTATTAGPAPGRTPSPLQPQMSPSSASPYLAPIATPILAPAPPQLDYTTAGPVGSNVAPPHIHSSFSNLTFTPANTTTAPPFTPSPTPRRGSGSGRGSGRGSRGGRGNTSAAGRGTTGGRVQRRGGRGIGRGASARGAGTTFHNASVESMGAAMGVSSAGAGQPVAAPVNGFSVLSGAPPTPTNPTTPGPSAAATAQPTPGSGHAGAFALDGAFVGPVAQDYATSPRQPPHAGMHGHGYGHGRDPNDEPVRTVEDDTDRMQIDGYGRETQMAGEMRSN